jgi:F-type H+-transporting ATPase subunit a
LATDKRLERPGTSGAGAFLELVITLAIGSPFQEMLGKNLPLSNLVSDPSITGIHLPQLGPINLGTVGDIHADTIILSWVAMAGILLYFGSVSSSLVVEGPGSPNQAVAEGVYTFIADIAKQSIGEHRYRTYVPLLCGMFLFILVSNLIGIMPWQVIEHMHGWPQVGSEHFEVAATTTDFNTTAGLALVAIITYLGSGVMVHKLEYIKMFTIKPIMMLEWLDIVIRPSTLALRLLLVITADELLRTTFLTICPALVPAGVMAFEVFIALVQAFVFTLLTAIYVGTAVAEHH